ncbi:MAG TPA: M64 family metallopeptidase [Thermoanaerobaculia bacterium]|nr:M64 family metallopeptidase [Thermoanaerobaculia bacterium]
MAACAAVTLFPFAEKSSFSASSAPPSPASASPTPAASPAFDARFTGRTMRVDLFHTGGPKGEVVALDRCVDDGPWPGSRTRLLDETNLGSHLFEVRDARTNRVIFSRGFSSIYSEWEQTDEVKHVSRTFPESLRLPWPREKVRIVLERRDNANIFHELFSVVIDPAGAEANPAPRAPMGKVWTVFENGRAAAKLDLLLLGEGYAEKDLPKFHADVKRLVDILFTYEPFKSRKADFNVRALDLPDSESGVFRPDSKIFRRTPLSVQYGIFGSERYMLTYDDRALREAASAAPYDFLEILVNDARYGGGGIYNFQATASVDTGFAEYVFVHEFGHHFAGLADEYYGSDVAYETGREKPEPWEPNVTALKDPKALKWADLVEKGTPLPTPWEKDAFEKQTRAFQAERKKLIASGAPPSALDDLFRRQMALDSKLLSTMTWSGKVGAFEGASYEAKGLYRPSADCIMFTRDPGGFCPVCRRAIARVIDEYSRP